MGSGTHTKHLQRPDQEQEAVVCRSISAALIVVATASSFLCGSASAQSRVIADGLDNPRPRYYDYHPPGVFYGGAGPVGYNVYGYVAPVPVYPGGGFAAAAYGAPVYGYTSLGYAAPRVVAPVVPVARPICGVYRYWRNGRCLDRRGY
jgi:hypothetical protein